MTTCLILAAGDATRHNGGNKPLLEVDGETLLDRTIRLLDKYSCVTYIVTHRDDLKRENVSVFSPLARRWIVETLLNTCNLWASPGRTVVLLGDVYYTEDAFRAIFETHPIRRCAYGKGLNIHGIEWVHDDNVEIGEGLQRVVLETENHPRTHGAGKLWRWLQAADPPMGLVDFADETTDFDSPQEHKRFLAKYASHR